MSAFAIPVVTVTSIRPPSIAWRCPSCGDQRPFDCSERLRANTNGKVVDIWSIYRCRSCDTTKNVTVVERTPVRRVARDLLDAAHANDARVARRMARDVGLLRRHGLPVAEGDEWQLDGSAPRTSPFRLAFPEPLLVSLDRVLATALGVGRRQVPSLVRVDAGTRLDARRLWSNCLVTPLDAAARGDR